MPFLIFTFSVHAEKKNVCSQYSSRSYKRLWPAGSIRNQCGVGSCHAFQSIGMIEAAHSLYFDQNIDLSENDLFRQHLNKMNKGKKPSEHIANLANDTISKKDTGEIYQEGGYIRDDIELIKANGVCFENSRPYHEFEFKGDAYKAVVCLRESKKKIIGQAEVCDPTNSEDVKKLQGLCNDVANTFARLKIDEELTKVASRQCLQDRSKVKSFANSLKLKTEVFGEVSFEDKKKKLLSFLRCQPVGVSVKGYASLRKQKLQSKHDSGHALIIAGFDCATNKFIMRNSWGGDYEEVDADFLAHGTQAFSTLSVRGNAPDANGKCPDVAAREEYLAKNNKPGKFKIVQGNTYPQYTKKPTLETRGIGIYKNYYYLNGVPTYKIQNGKFIKL